MPRSYTRDELVERLVRAGELEVSGEDQDEVGKLFDTENFAFHGPDGFDTDYAGLTEFFRSLRAAFDDRTIRRGIIVAEGEYIACQTWIEGTFVHPFTQSPAGGSNPPELVSSWTSSASSASTTRDDSPRSTSEPTTATFFAS